MAKNSPKFVLVIDWETSGTTWTSFEETFQQYQGLTFGAIIADAETFEPIETLYREIQFDDKKYKWSTEAQGIHGKSREYLLEHGVSTEEAAIDLAELILKYHGAGKVMFAGHNAWFDIHATKQLLEQFGVMPELHHVVLDTSPLSFVLIGEYKSNAAFTLLGGIEARGLHNSLDDAAATLAVLRNSKQIFEKGLGS